MDSKSVIAVLVVLGCFGLLAPYVIRDVTPPDVILLIAGPSIAGVLAYYFGAHNGTITGLAASASQLASMSAQLANQAIEKRAQPAVVGVVATPVDATSGSAPPAP